MVNYFLIRINEVSIMVKTDKMQNVHSLFSCKELLSFQTENDTCYETNFNCLVKMNGMESVI